MCVLENSNHVQKKKTVFDVTDHEEDVPTI